MIQRQTLSNSRSKKGFSLGLQPAPAWMAIIGLVIFTAVGILAGAGKILNIALPALSFAVGAFLYWRYPLLYVSFTWWMFFLTSFVRRLVDWRSGFTNPSPILLSPFLVAIVTLVTFYRYLPRSYQQGGLPFILAFSAVFYGLLVGLINNPPVTTVLSFLSWLAPILFGFHLLVNWRDYPSYRQNIQRTFVWGVLVTGTYGVYQYIVAPEWDRLWLIETGLTIAGGSPEPFKMRVWSTMNSAAPFATVMIAGLMLLFSSQGSLRIPASVVGYLSLLLTAVRTAWGGWLVGFITFTISLKANLQMRLIITVLVMAVCIFPLATVDPFSQMIQSRLESFSNLENDDSLKARSGLYKTVLTEALSEFLGKGIGSVGAGFDSGIMETLISLGWLGTIPYMGGVLLIFFSLFQGREGRSDPFASAARSISFGLVPMLAGANVMVAASGMIFWGFLGIGMAARKYYQHQQSTNSF